MPADAAVALSDVHIVSTRHTTEVWQLHAGEAQGDGRTFYLTHGVTWQHQASTLTAPGATWLVSEQRLEALSPVAVQSPLGTLWGGAAHIALDSGAMTVLGPVTGTMTP